jgi:hypothetical protein
MRWMRILYLGDTLCLRCNESWSLTQGAALVDDADDAVSDNPNNRSSSRRPLNQRHQKTGLRIGVEQESRNAIKRV